MATLAQAFVAILPDMRAFSPALATGMRQVSADAKKHGEAAGSSFAGGLLKTATTAMVGFFAATKIVDFTKQSVQAARESVVANQMVAAAIKTTGGAANVTSGQISQLADRLMAKTAVDDEVIKSGAVVLLTFKKVRDEAGAGNQVFSRATTIGLDMAAVLGISVPQASKVLGKALNDPIVGMTALRRVGITFNQQQQEQIKTMVASGNVMGAQKIILTELEGRFKGAAAAAADPGKKALVAWGEFKEYIGSILLPLLDRFATWFVQTGLPAIQNLIGGVISIVRWMSDWKIAIGAVTAVLSLLFAASKVYNAYLLVSMVGGLKVYIMQMNIVTIATKVWTAVTWLMNGALRALSGPVGIVITIIAALVAGVIYAYKNFGWFRTAVDTAWNGIKAASSWAWNNVLKPIFVAVSAYVRAMAAIYQWLWGIIRGVWNSISSHISGVWRTISGVFTAMGNFVKWTLTQAFQTGVNTLKSIWNGLVNIFKGPVNFLIDPVYDRGIRGIVGAVARAIGATVNMGWINKFATGGAVPGSGRGDKVPALLEPGEYIVRRDGSNLHEAFNWFGAPGHQDGGGIGGFFGRVWGGITGAASAVWDKAAGAAGWIWGALQNAAKAVMQPIRNALGGLFNRFGMFGSLLKGGAGWLLDKIWGWIVGKDKEAPAPAGSVGGTGVTRWTPVVLQALGMLGQPSSWLNVVLRRMNQESGGNPNAINLWDTNAAAGMPSQGLMQVIPPTFFAYAGALASRGILDPLANIYAGLNYALHRYGSLSALNQPGGYDLGGILSPGALGLNSGRRPERILSAQQTEAFERLVTAVEGGGSLGGNISVTTYYPVAEPTSVTVNRALTFAAALGR